jgi:pyruvate-formate lyase-activating enzyme
MIRYKSITHERVEDAPFVGALICAVSCSIGCKDCFNESVKQEPNRCSYIPNILDEIQANPFNEGVILAGLEWSSQPKELIALVKEATKRHLPIIIYTGYTSDQFIRRVPRIKEFPNVLIKYGSFNQNLRSFEHKEYGVNLASTNQHIQKISELMSHTYEHVI